MIVKTEKKTKDGKKSKQRVTVAFFVSADGGKVGKPIAIWKSENPRCFCNWKIQHHQNFASPLKRAFTPTAVGC